MAVSGSQIFQAQDARGYPLLILLGLVACWIMAWIERHGTSIWIASSLSMAALAMLLTHYFAAGAIAGMFIYAVVRLQSTARRHVLIALTTAVILFAILWGPTLWMQTSYVAESADIFLKEPAESHFTNFLARLAQEPLRLLFEPRNPNWLTGLLGLLVVIAAIIKLRRGPALLFWFCWYAGIVGLVAVFDLSRGTIHLQFIRYTILASPAVCIVLATASDQFKGLWRHSVPVVAVAVCLLNIQSGYSARDINPDLRPLARYLDDIAKEGEPVLFISNDPLGRNGQTLYLGMSLYAHISAHPLICATRPLETDLLLQLPADRDLLVVSPVLNVDMQQVIGGCEVVQRMSFSDVGECLKVRLPRASATSPSN